MPPSPSYTSTPEPATLTPEHETATPTGVVLASPTATASTSTVLYLPIVLAEHCPPKNAYVDVVLVLDASTSMRESTASGYTKAELAQEAVRAFLEGMRLFAGGDRVALVSFNEEAYVLQDFSSVRSVLSASLDRMNIREFSRLDLGLETATTLLTESGRDDGRLAIVVLSDGLVNPVGPERVLDAAVAAKEEGAAVYAVGFGPALDEILLELVADSGRYYQVREPTAIVGVYSDLTRIVPCAPGMYWARR
jgi:Mg-chelatase subunit ChlD